MKFVWFFCAILVYLILFYSIVDVYLSSPLVRGIAPIALNSTPLATHLVFIVSDGLRPDFLFGKTLKKMPFIRDLILNQGVWGLSHTRVPTESRPGHVAMLAGFYEDISSVFKGWQKNAVEFDSIFNQSAQAWAGGAESIFEGFVSPDAKPFQLHIYPTSHLDLSQNTSFDADDWVVDKFVAHVDDTSSNGFFATGHGTIAVLHLEDADLLGHSQHPGSPVYYDLLLNLDHLVGKVVGVTETRSAEKGARVAYILSADHGMTEWGSHGGGSPHETITPFMAWGSGIVHPTHPPASRIDFDVEHLDEFGIPLSLVDRKRYEITQADLCPLMAAIIGVPIPVNSVGTIPFDVLKTSDAEKAQLAKANFLQLYSQFLAKEEEKQRSHFSIFFRPFSTLSKAAVEERLNKIEEQKGKSDYYTTVSGYRELIGLALEGLNYYHNYDRPFFTMCIGASFCLSSLTTLCLLVGPVDVKPVDYSTTNRSLASKIQYTLVGMIVFVILFSYSWPLMHTVYQLLPLLLGLFLSISKLRRAQLSLLSDMACLNLNPQASSSSVLGLCIVALAVIELIVFGFLHRSLLSGACWLIGIWPLLDRSFGYGRNQLRSVWTVGCIMLSIFPMLPVIGKNRNFLIVYVGSFALMFLVSPLYRLLHPVQRTFSLSAKQFSVPRSSLSTPVASICCLVVSTTIVWLINITDGQLPFFRLCIHTICWLSLGLIAILPLVLTSTRIGARLFAWAVGLTSLLILLSTHYEVIFFATFMAVCIIWIQMEATTSQSTELWNVSMCQSSSQSSSMSDMGDLLPTMQPTARSHDALNVKTFRQSLFFIFFLVMAFFGTGNIASLNSFDTRTTYCFTTTLEPAIMAFILMIKILLPMLLLGLVYSIVQFISRSPPNPSVSSSPLSRLESVSRWDKSSSSVLTQTGTASIVSNLIAFQFFLMLRDTGSWLEIGNSISNYIIGMVIGLVAFLFALLGRLMMTQSLTGLAAPASSLFLLLGGSRSRKVT